jgi:hypothetical protein
MERACDSNYDKFIQAFGGKNRKGQTALKIYAQRGG